MPTPVLNGTLSPIVPGPFFGKITVIRFVHVIATVDADGNPVNRLVCVHDKLTGALVSSGMSSGGMIVLHAGFDKAVPTYFYMIDPASSSASYSTSFCGYLPTLAVN